MLLGNLSQIVLDSSKFGMHLLRTGGASQVVTNSGFQYGRAFKKHGSKKYAKIRN